jgi:hypothetical protein
MIAQQKALSEERGELPHVERIDACGR